MLDNRVAARAGLPAGKCGKCGRGLSAPIRWMIAPTTMNDCNRRVAPPRQLPHSELPHSRNLRLHRLSDASATFFITKSLRPKKPILNAAARDTVLSAFKFAVDQERLNFRAFVVMPD